LVAIDLDSWTSETFWRIKDGSGRIVVEGGDYGDQPAFATVTELVSLESDTEFTFVLGDAFGDGLDGRANVFLGDEMNYNKLLGYYDYSMYGLFGSRYEFTFVAGDSGIVSNPYGTTVPTDPPTPWPTPSGPTLPVLFEIYTDSWPSETGFEVSLDGDVVFALYPGTFTQGQTLYSELVILADGEDYEVTLIDSFGDGLSSNFTVYLGEEPDDDKILAYYDGIETYFSSSFTMNFTVSEDSIINVTTYDPPLTEPPTPWPTPSGPTLPVLFEIYTDSWPSETGFEVSLDGEVVFALYPGTFTQGQTLYSELVILADGEDYEVTLIDSFGDGLSSNFTVYLGEEPDDDKILAYYDGIETYFSSSFTMNFTVSEDSIINVMTYDPPLTEPLASGSLSPPCNVCGQGMAVTTPEAIWDYSSGLRCDIIELAGQVGLIGEEVCSILPALIGEVCGCAN
jgi:hypothetical protein